MINQKQFRYPYSFDERAPCILDRVIFIPSYYFNHESFKMPAFNSEELFGNDNPVYVEFCSGNGEWIVNKAIEFPHINWVAVEIKFKRIRKIWSKIKNHNLKNLVIAFGDANDFVKHYLQSETVDGMFVNFPDPWPKEKHAKHRLIKHPFIEEMKKALKKGSEICIVTDHEDYSNQIITEMMTQFESKHPNPFFTNKSEDYGSSYFNRLWESKGKEIRFMQFVAV